jgi:hypothetical protein
VPLPSLVTRPLTLSLLVVIVRTTTTEFRNQDGSIADNPSDSKGSGDSSKWKIAVGVAVPLAVIAAALAAFLLWKRRQRRRAAVPPTEPVSEHRTSTAPTPVSRKPVASPAVSALSGPTEVSGQGVRQELNPQGVDAIPTAPPAYTGGRHEVQGEVRGLGSRAELQDQELRGPDPAVEVSGQGRSSELAGVYERPRSELPGNDRFQHN